MTFPPATAPSRSRPPAEYHRPATLRLPKRPPKLVYLDLNHWVSLAKAQSGHPGGAPFREALDLCADAVDRRARVAEQKLVTDRENLRRQEELDMAQVVRQRRMDAENLATQRQAVQLAQELFQSEMAAEEAKVNTEAPVRLLRIVREGEILREELGMQELRTQVRAHEVEHDLLLPRAEHELRREMLPLEQAPQIVESAAKVFQGANLSIYSQNAELLGQLGPVFEILARAIHPSTRSGGPRVSEGDEL